MMASEIVNNVSRWGIEAQESNNKIKNLERTKEENLSLIDTGGGDICFVQLVGGDYCFDIEGFMGYLDSDQESSKKMNLEASGFVIVSGVGVGNDLLEESRTLTKEYFSAVGDCSATNQCEIGGFRFDDQGAGDLCSDGFDINWLVRCLDSDKQELDEFGGGLCLDDLSGGDLCFNDHLDGKDLCSDDFDIDLFMRCLDSDKEDEAVKDNTLDSDKEDEPVKDNAISKVVRRKFKISNQELDEFDGGFCLDDLCVGDLCVDEDSDFGIDWFVRCLDSDQKEDPVEDDQLERREYEAELGGDFCCDDLSGFNIDWFMQILDSNQEEPVEHRTSSNLGKRKFEAEVNQTGPKRRVVSNY